MKNLSPRDILEITLFVMCFILLFAVAGAMETEPLATTIWVGGGLSVLLWIFYVFVVAQQRAQEAKLVKRMWIRAGGQWVPIDPAMYHQPTMVRYTQPIFDQDEQEVKS